MMDLPLPHYLHFDILTILLVSILVYMKSVVRIAKASVTFCTLFQRLFVNRDYVFIRRYLIDHETNTLYIMNKTIEHGKFPKYPEKYRVEDYWSVMVIRPYTDMSKPGIEFSLTYFDNPGVNIPASVTNWVAMRAMPDFLDRLRKATVEYRQYCVQEGTSEACLKIAKEEKEAEEKRQRDKLDYCSFEKTGKNAINVNDNIQNIIDSTRFRIDLTEEGGKKVDSLTSAEVTSKSSKSFWKYFHPMYYFH